MYVRQKMAKSLRIFWDYTSKHPSLLQGWPAYTHPHLLQGGLPAPTPIYSRGGLSAHTLCLRQGWLASTHRSPTPRVANLHPTPSTPGVALPAPTPIYSRGGLPAHTPLYSRGGLPAPTHRGGLPAPTPNPPLLEGWPACTHPQPPSTPGVACLHPPHSTLYSNPYSLKQTAASRAPLTPPLAPRMGIHAWLT